MDLSRPLTSSSDDETRVSGDSPVNGPGRIGNFGPVRIGPSIRNFSFSFFADTPLIRILAISVAYPYQIRIRYGIRHLTDVSVFLSDSS
uniref:Uncharacterized protein n=1 Tax=Arundo donax TaxID=35708 RepID=A0A0A9FZQ5_ARUDO